MNKFNIIVLIIMLLSGCVVTPPSRPEPIYTPAYPQMPDPGTPTLGAVYQENISLNLFEDSRARRVGDVLTIHLEEQTSSSKSAETSISKTSETAVPNPTVFGELLKGDNNTTLVDMRSDNGFSGGAESDQENSLSGTLTAVVADVLPNGLLLVQGEKWLNLNRGEEYVRVSGLVRPEDVDATNTVSSLRLADARLAYSGTGELADSNEAGWLTRFFLHPINPF